MPVSYISHKGKGYVLDGESLHELRSGGLKAVVQDPRLVRRVLAGGHPIGEPEALILAYRSDDEIPEKRPKQTEEASKARNWMIAMAIMLLPLVILALALDSGLGFFVEVISLFVVMPAFLFAAVFVAVVVTALSVLVVFVFNRLRWRFGS